jgi:TolB-like protein
VKSFFSELRRRNVVKVGAAYVIVAWLIAQVAELALDSFEAPGWVMKTLLLLMALGLPLVLVFAWAFELTPEGIKREADVERDESVTDQTGRKLIYVIIGAAVLAGAVIVLLPQGADEPPPLASADAVDDHSVAILPFVNMSSDPEQEYFSDGITEEIINAVVKIPNVSVPARTSVFAYRDHRGDIREIGSSLGVAHVLEGSVRSQGDAVRITAQLIKVDDGFHLWSETFDRKLENIFAVQEEIAGAIAQALVGELGTGVETVPNQTRNMAAYDTYLQGRAALRKRDPETVDLLEQATTADPGFAPAWAALAIAYQSITEDDNLAIETARKALALDPDNVDALNAMGAALRRMRRWLEAEPYFDKALAIDPNSAELLEDYAEFLMYVGRTDEALTITRRGMDIDSRLRPLEYAHIDALASNGLATEALEQAHRSIDGSIETAPYTAATFWYLIWVLFSPDVDASLHPKEIPADPGTDEQDLITNLSTDAASVFLATANDATIERLKAYYPSTEDVAEFQASSNPDLFYVETVARDALILANELDYVVEQDIQFARQLDRVLHEFTWSPFYAELRQHPRFGEYLEAAGIVEYWDATRWPDWCDRATDGAIRCR